MHAECLNKSGKPVGSLVLQALQKYGKTFLSYSLYYKRNLEEISVSHAVRSIVVVEFIWTFLILHFKMLFSGIDGPTNVVTDRVTEDTATVSWNKVQASIDRYMVRYTSADGDTRETEVGSENSIITLLNLKPGMEYTIHIWAEKGPHRSKKASTRALTGKLQWRQE